MQIISCIYIIEVSYNLFKFYLKFIFSYIKFIPFEKRYLPGWIYDPDSLEPRMEEDNVPF